MDNELEGRVAVVTGASRGIGAAIVHRLVDSGARVFGVARKQAGLDALVGECPAGAVVAHAAHAGCLENVREGIAGAIQPFGRLDIVVNNAATNSYVGPAMGIDTDQFDKTVGVDQRGPFVWTRQAWSQWFARGHSEVVLNTASIGAYRTALGLACTT